MILKDQKVFFSYRINLCARILSIFQTIVLKAPPNPTGPHLLALNMSFFSVNEGRNGVGELPVASVRLISGSGLSDGLRSWRLKQQADTHTHPSPVPSTCDRAVRERGRPFQRPFKSSQMVDLKHLIHRAFSQSSLRLVVVSQGLCCFVSWKVGLHLAPPSYFSFSTANVSTGLLCCHLGAAVLMASKYLFAVCMPMVIQPIPAFPRQSWSSHCRCVHSL